ncbi:hypothetical protein FHG87_020101 [Trinorchestia longiramus]|nr:hypothetical protein FHG87_020101 [Trinorchestia longiramus]
MSAYPVSLTDMCELTARTSNEKHLLFTASLSARSRDLIHNTSRRPLDHGGYRNEDQSQLYLLGDPTDPVEIWRNLQNTFQKKSWANKFRLKKKLFNIKMESGQNLQDHLKVFVELFEELAIIGDAMEEEERVIILLSSLADWFSTLVTVLEAHEKIPAWEVVTERLLNEERRQRDGPGTSDSSDKLLVSFKRNKKLIKGFECGKEGHIKKQRRVYEERLKKENRAFQATKAVDARSSSTGETIMFTSAFPIGNVDCDSWIVDSGATQHMCNKKSQFSSYSDLSSPVRVEMGDGRALKGVGVGDVRLKITLPNMQTKNEVFLEQSAYTKCLFSWFGMDNANSVATPVDVNADLVTTSDEVEEYDKDLYQSAVVTDKCVGYSDADWAGDRSDRKSTSGYCFTLSNSVITWRSVKQSCVALSTAEAEYVALAGTAQEAIWLKQLLDDLEFKTGGPMVLNEDNHPPSVSPRIPNIMVEVSILISNFIMFVIL